MLEKIHCEKIQSGKLQHEKPDWFWSQSQQMLALLENLRIAASKNFPVLIVGETGSGKELVAHKLYELRRAFRGSTQTEAPFLPINVSTIPENLAESILFGHERGAFTSARERQIGKFELAKKGTLFLDEIQNLSPQTQSKLLRVLQSREIDRLGARERIPVECQIVAASNKPLEYLVEQGLFRRDLYYRLNTFPIYLPPLRERKNEIPNFLDSFAQDQLKVHSIDPKPLHPEVVQTFSDYAWPGNFRELEHALLYANLKSHLHAHNEILSSDLPPQFTGQSKEYFEKGSWI
jgi:formate hydrogenlyase transcriptional activator